MNYLDTYFSRVNHLGTTTAERIRNGGIRSFDKWMAESPHTVRNLSVERGLYFNGIILTNKDKAYINEFNNDDPYDLFLSGPEMLIEIENDKAITDKELIIFRDSFGSSLSPLLVSAYKKVIIVDLRYIASVCIW